MTRAREGEATQMQTLFDTDSYSDLPSSSRLILPIPTNPKQGFVFLSFIFQPSPAGCPVSSICVQHNAKTICQEGLLLQWPPRDRSVAFLLELQLPFC